MIRNIFFRLGAWMICALTLLIALPAAPSFAGTQTLNQRRQVCNVIIEYPSHMEFGLENATCDQNGNLVGEHSISITVDLAVRNGVRFTFDSNFLNGRLNGLTSIQTDAGFSFDGEIFPNGRAVGRTTAFDGSVVEGETRGGVANLTGTVTRRNGQVLYYINGRESEASAFADNQSPSPTSGKVSLPEVTYTAASEMTNVTALGITCLADMPALIYTIKSKLKGKCENGYYSGPAKLTLTPKVSNDYEPMIASLVYQNGQIASAVELKYTNLNMLFSGDLVDWLPYSGNAVQDIGNDNYLILQLEDGREIYRNTEYRQPKASTLALRKLVSNLVTTVSTNAVDCVIGSCARERRERKAQERQTAIYQQQQTQIREQQRQNDVARQAENDRYEAEQANIRSQQLAVIEDARIKQLAGLDRDGNPIVQPVTPVVIVRNDPPTVFVADTNPPAPTVTTNPQSDPPAITTQPPELALPTVGTSTQGADLAPPLPSGQPLPEQSPAPLAPPVQLGGGGDTLETGPAPSYPAPQNPVPTTTELTYEQVMTPDELALNNRLPYAERATTLYSPSQIRMIKADGRWENWLADARRLTAPVQVIGPSPTPAVTQQVSGPTRPDVPTGLYPTNPGELAQPIPLGWSAVTGATRYRLTVKNQITGGFPVDDIFVTSNSYTVQNLPAGTSFSWDVAACNAVGCSGRSANGSFRTGGAGSIAPTRTLTYDDVLYPRERGIFDEHFGYLSRIPESNPPAKFTPEHIKRMQDGGRWQGYIVGIEKDNEILRQIDSNPPDFCGSDFTSFVPDRIVRTEIYPACRTHDACYASASTQLQCDTGIKQDIQAICRAKGASNTCYFAAKSYYTVLRRIGHIAYNNAQSRRQK